MPSFVVALNLKGGRGPELVRAARMLDAAGARSSATATVTVRSFRGRGGEGVRHVCLIGAEGIEAAQHLMSVALVPHGPIRAISDGARDRLLRARHPGGDVDPRLEPELVEDVVDVGLDRSLGQE